MRKLVLLATLMIALIALFPMHIILSGQVSVKGSIREIPTRKKPPLLPDGKWREAKSAYPRSSNLQSGLMNSRLQNAVAGTATLEWAKHYGSGANESIDEATAIAVDKSGNFFVTGRSTQLSFGADYCTVKYDASGTEIWVARYDSGYEDHSVAVAVDGTGNVYVTGYSASPSSSWDFITIKYDADGREKWVRRYNGPGDSDDQPSALSVDSSGYVYITGYSTGSDSYNDYATIKYTSDGDQLWVARYNGALNSYDGASALVVDGTGNVYVTGYSGGSATSNDYTTIKYDAAGVQVWVSRYDGPLSSDDEANALAVDKSGNVYVTGSSNGLGTYSDYATVKYDAAGVQQWVARYNGPGNSHDGGYALAVDGSGNVFVTGFCEDSTSYLDFATIKYDQAGNEKWAVSYDGPGNSADYASFIYLDGSGNAYVAGSSIGFQTSKDYTTIKYDAAGNEQWVARYNGPGYSDDQPGAFAADESGNIYLTGYSTGLDTYYDYATVKYSPDGNEQLAVRYNGLGNSDDEARALAVDNSGNVIVTGHSLSSDTYKDIVTVKYDAAGSEKWMMRFDGSSSSDDEPNALVVDGSGNVYVAGYSVDYENSNDFATIKYSENGDQVWLARYNGPFNSYDGVNALALDGSGNVYVTGYSVGADTSYDYATIKYDAAGAEQWVARYNGPGKDDDVANAIAVDDLGFVYVTGHGTGSDTTFDITTIKYNSSGVEQWVASYNGPGHADDEAFDLAVDTAGNIYITGYSTGSGTSYDITTIKYDAGGSELWVMRYDGPLSSYDAANALAVDASGSVYVTGYSGGAYTSYDYTTIKYDAAGNEQWVARYNGARNSYDYANALVVDDLKNVYITGTCVGSNNYYEYATIKYDAAGNEQWTVLFDLPGYNDSGSDIAVDATGTVYVTGTSDNSFGTSAYTTLKYKQNPTLAEQSFTSMPQECVLDQNHPNPFNPSTRITYHLASPVMVTLTVYDLLGREVSVLVNKLQLAGEHTANFNLPEVGRELASGLYFYRLKAGRFIEQKKMLLVK